MGIYITGYNLYKYIYNHPLLLGAFLVIIVYFLFSNSGPRNWSKPDLSKPKFKIVFEADSIVDNFFNFDSKLFGTDKFKTVYKSNSEREKIRNEAKEFFSKQFGLSDWYLDSLMTEVNVNPKGKYRMSIINGNRVNSPLKDYGFTCPILPYMKLTGKYGGKLGAINYNGIGTLAYGHYEVDGFKIKYKSMCPLTSTTTYDGTYTFIDCDVKIIKSPNKKLIGMKGKAEGLYKKFKTSNKNWINIRNVLNFK